MGRVVRGTPTNCQQRAAPPTGHPHGRNTVFDLFTRQPRRQPEATRGFPRAVCSLSLWFSLKDDIILHRLERLVPTSSCRHSCTRGFRLRRSDFTRIIAVSTQSHVRHDKFRRVRVVFFRPPEPGTHDITHAHGALYDSDLFPARFRPSSYDANLRRYDRAANSSDAQPRDRHDRVPLSML